MAESTAASPTTSPRIEARRATTRALILEAAWELAREVGLTGFSLRELAGRVGMRAPSLYEYFAGKDAIYDAMFAQGNLQFLEIMRAVPATDEVGRHGALTAAMRAFLDFATDDPVRYQLLFQHAVTGWQPSPDAYATAVDAYELMRQRLAEIGASDQRSLDLLTALVSGLASQQVANDPHGRRWHDLVDEVAELYLAHVDEGQA